MKKTTKKITLSIFTILAIFLTIQSAMAIWSQYSPSPTSDTIVQIKVIGDYAIARTANADPKLLYYNGAQWNEIIQPTPVPLQSGQAYLEIDRASDGNFYLFYFNQTTFHLYRMTPSTGTFTNVQITNLAGVTINTASNPIQNFACVKQGSGYVGTSNDFECFYIQLNGSARHAKGIGSANALITPNIGSSTVQFPKIFANRNLYVTRHDTGFTSEVKRFNGISFTNIFSSATSGSTADLSEIDGNYVVWSSSFGTRIYNQTSGTLGIIRMAQTPTAVHLNDDDLNIYFSNTTGLYRMDYAVGFPTQLMLTGNTMQAIDIDPISQNKWAGGNNGLLYKEIISTTVGASSIITISPNPSIYGQSTQIGATPYHDGGFSADVTINIYNNTGSNIYGVACTVPNNIICSTTISGVTWTNFVVGQTYNVVVQTDWSNGNTHTTNTSWSVVANATTQSTNYVITETSSYSHPQLSNIVATARSANNHGYFTATNGSSLYILSADSNNINNLVIKQKILSLTSGADYPTSLDAYTNILYYGTNDELYKFGNATGNDATKLQQYATSNGFGLFTDDFIQSITVKNNNTAWVCRKGSFSDDANLFNLTNDDFGTNIAINPCRAIIYHQDVLYAHRGLTGVIIYNETTQTLITSIAVTSYPSTSNNDVLSIYGNTLALVSATNRVRLYDITNPASPSYITQCLIATAEIRAIELLNANTVIIGTNAGQLRVCDTNNNATYDSTNVGYITTNLKSYSSGEVTYEIERMNDEGKFQVAEGNKYSVYVFQSNTQTTTSNNPPSINEINTAVNSVCYGEILNVQILASDPDGDDLTYDWACEGIKVSMTNNYLTNSFTCSYNSGTTKTIKVFVKDSKGAIVTSTKNIAVSNCTPENKIELKVLDGQTTQPVDGATVTIAGQGSQLTSSTGVVLFNNLSSSTTYTISLSKAGYFTKTVTGTTSPYQQYVYLDPTTTTTGQQITTLIFLVRDTNGDPIENALTSVTEPITGQSKYAFSDASGTATITNMFSTSKGIYSVSKAGAFDIKQDYFTLFNGEQKTIIIQLMPEGTNYDSGRGCQDYVKGVFLCSPLRVDGIGDKCTQDSDCITDRCEETTSNSQRTCSIFNWTLCDSVGMERSGSCVTKFSTAQGARNLTNWGLDNFLFVMVGIVFFIMLIMFLSAVRKR